MKHVLLAAAGLAVAATAVATPAPVQAEAGPFDSLKKKVKKVKKKAKEVEQAAQAVESTVEAVKDGRAAEAVAGAAIGAATGGTSGIGRNAAIRQGLSQRSNYPKTASRGNYLGRAAAMPGKFANATDCANVGLGNAFIAVSGKYTFQQGISTEERDGLLEREPVSPTNGCVLPAMGSGEVLYVEVDKGKYNKHNYALQCAAYDGSQQLDNTNAPPENNYGGRHVMLHTGNSTGYTPTASGSNSDRTSAYAKYLAGRGREMITFNMPDLHTDKSGTDFYCQHFNKATGKSALAFTFRRGPVGRSQ